jgi:malonyl CoA-acyl carrier protein transacylase
MQSNQTDHGQRGCAGRGAFKKLLSDADFEQRDGMPDRAERARRKEILNANREQNRRAVRDQFPIGVPVLKSLFDHLDAQLSTGECDDTLRFAREFIAGNGLSEELIVGWLEKNGGYCDCEALNNVEEIVEDAAPGYRERKSDSR